MDFWGILLALLLHLEQYEAQTLLVFDCFVGVGVGVVLGELNKNQLWAIV